MVALGQLALHQTGLLVEQLRLGLLHLLLAAVAEALEHLPL
jgi:hypothetical protein